MTLMIIKGFRYIGTGDYFCIDCHLRDYPCNTVLEAAQKDLQHYTTRTNLEPITIERLLNERIIRQMYYMVSVGEKFLIVKDAELNKKTYKNDKT